MLFTISSNLSLSIFHNNKNCLLGPDSHSFLICLSWELCLLGLLVNGLGLNLRLLGGFTLNYVIPTSQLWESPVCGWEETDGLGEKGKLATHTHTLTTTKKNIDALTRKLAIITPQSIQFVRKGKIYCRNQQNI